VPLPECVRAAPPYTPAHHRLKVNVSAYKHRGLRLSQIDLASAEYEVLYPVYTIQPVVRPVVQPVVQPVVTGLTTGCYRVNKHPTGCQTGLTTVLNEQPLFVQPVVKPSCTTGLTTGCIYDTTEVVKPV